jgi:TPR repeat protein
MTANRLALRKYYFEQGCALDEQGAYEGAAEYFLKGADLGHTGCQINLGNLLSDYLVPPRPREAAAWYRKAWKAGNPSGGYNLGLLYRSQGRIKLYRRWMQKMIDLGGDDAEDALEELAEPHRQLKLVTAPKN